MQEATNLETEVETTETEAPEVEETEEQTKEADEGQSEEGEEGEPSKEADEFFEQEIDGELYKLPAKLKDKFMFQADYTRKTQELSEAKRAWEAEQATHKKSWEEREADFKSHAELHAIDVQLEQYKGLDWTQIINDDPNRAFLLQREEQALRAERDKRINEINQRKEKTALEKQQESAKRIQQSAEILQREVGGWTQEKAQSVSNYLKSLNRIGVDEKTLHDINMGVYGAVPIVLAHKAMLYDQLVKKQASKPESQIKPLPKMPAGKSTQPLKYRPEMSDRDYEKLRRQRIKSKST